MYKVIDLGCSVPKTGEQRVRLLDVDTLVKTASTPTEIQQFWNSIKKEDNSAYLWVIGVSAMEYYGCNNNGDAFTESDLIKTHPTFIDNAHIFMHHVNKDPAKSIGRPVFSWYNKDMHRVELILKLDKTLYGAATIIDRIKNGEQLYVSMGCSLPFDVCSICGNQAPTRAHYCDHLKYNLKKILPDGKQVYALNPNPKFFDISIVNRPADPTAFALDKIASEYQETAPEITSAELGELAEERSTKIAALHKVSDLIKEVEGQIADAKDSGPIKEVYENGTEDLDYEDFDHDKLTKLRVSPAGLSGILMRMGAPLTFSDAMWMSGNHVFGDNFCREHECSILELLPKVLSMLRKEPEIIDDIVPQIMSHYNGELASPTTKTIIINITKPVAESRIRIIGNLSKTASSYSPLSDYGPGNFETVHFKDGSTTTKYHLDRAKEYDNITRVPAKILGATLGVAALTAAIAAPKLTDKLVYGAVLGIPSIALLTHGIGAKKTETASNGEEYIKHIKDTAWKAGTMQKHASYNIPFSPAMFELDYAVMLHNLHI